MDYTSGPYTVIIPAGQTNATFDVPIIDDSILEGNEDFIITINSSSLPSDVNVGTPGEATVNIVDDDCKLVIDFSIYCQKQSLTQICKISLATPSRYCFILSKSGIDHCRNNTKISA